MEKQYLSLALVICTIINAFVGATSIVPFFYDTACQNSFFTGQASLIAYNGACGQMPWSQMANSVDPSQLDSCCAVTVYSDHGCNVTPTLAPKGFCTISNISSYSVDCPCMLSNIIQSTSSTLPSTPPDTIPVQSPSVAPTSRPLSVISSSSSMTTVISPSSVSSSTDDIPTRASTTRSNDSPLPLTTSLQSSPLSPSAPAASKGGNGSGGGNGLGVPAQIALGVIIPGFSLIVAVIFGVRKWNRP